MGRLGDLQAYIDDRLGTVGAIEQCLCKLQAKYETYFNEVAAVRESELAQLSDHIARDRGKLPEWLERSLDEAQATVEKELDAEIARLEAERERIEGEAEEVRRQSALAEKAIHEKNVDLDEKEEALKERSEKLVASIESYNGRIRELGGGFGFFKNIFGMRRIQVERRALDEEQATVAAQIETVRSLWARREEEHAKRESEMRARWVELKTKATALQAKVEYLKETRPRLLFRSTVERVLFRRMPDPAAPRPGDPPCPRCRAPNPPSSHFCRICAARLGKDRPDLEGSIQEIAEVNLHHLRFSEGMRACQQIVGLVRGLKSGLEAFRKSVEAMIANESRYPLPKLAIDCPPASRQFGRSFDGFKAAVEKDLSLHPKEFAAQVAEAIGSVFTEANIKGYFETMGEELSRQAKKQWG